MKRNAWRKRWLRLAKMDDDERNIELAWPLAQGIIKGTPLKDLAGAIFSDGYQAALEKMEDKGGLRSTCKKCDYP